ncbi:uncharacterized protein BJX67DRAFT_386059 [Aspergillus lucknowensis]|uniref:DUF7730 domain-containing protein n=1 Tax=Aspergillus lucknowensis TaxID=176173 RepID=A0ABR4L933_9EURO
MKSIKKWTRKIIRRKATVDGPSQALDPLPFLNTPALPQSTGACQLSYQENYGLFGRLPLEIRQEILEFAFGKRTLHVDLRYGPPYPTQGAQGQTENRLTQRCTWRWFSCVCHRATEPPDIHSLGAVARPPCDDKCVPTRIHASGYTEPPTANTGIGVMGWLLACHMSYQDGMQILFTTNTFHFSGLDLHQHLPRLIPPQRLADIPSLELIWDLTRPRHIHSRRKDHLLDFLWERYMVTYARRRPSSPLDSPLDELCRVVVPETFPRLRHLYISLQDHIAPPLPRIFEDPVAEVEWVILRPIEEMVRALGVGREVHVAIQLGGWEVLRRRHLKLNKGDLNVESRGGLGLRFWKTLDGATRQQMGLGYWLCAGWNDVHALGGALFYDDADLWGEGGS